MCIAILNKKTALSIETIQNSWDNNNQGGGLLYVESGILTSFKTFDYNEFIQKYYDVRGNISTPIVLHFRIATSGMSKENTDNLHPFFVNSGLAFVHNGVISGLGNKKHSDTNQFNSQILQKLPINFLQNSGIIELIKNRIGYSKLIFLDNKNKYTIINDNLGHWDQSGNWFSNDSYKSWNDFEYYGNKKVSKKQQKATKNDYFDFDYDYKIESKSILSKTDDEFTHIEKLEFLADVYMLSFFDLDFYENLECFINQDGFKDLNEAFDYWIEQNY